jgi:sec-independent protein translocase protein TatC
MASDNESMTFWEHLEELRQRIIRSTIAVCICVFASLIFIKPIESILLFPIKTSINSLLASTIDRAIGSEGSMVAFMSIALNAQGAGIDVTLINIGPLSAIMAFFKIGLTAGVLLASPVLLYQLWSYIFPALTQREKRFALPLFCIIVLFFLAGTVFAYFIVVPVVLQFAAGLWSETDQMWDLERYVGFITRLLLGFGIAFELPIVMAFLAWIDVINSRGFREKQRHAMVVIFILSALLTPADPASMFLMAVPLIGLYQLGIFFAYLVEQEPDNYA